MGLPVAAAAAAWNPMGLPVPAAAASSNPMSRYFNDTDRVLSTNTKQQIPLISDKEWERFRGLHTQEGAAVAAAHLGHTSQPEGVGVPQGESSASLRVRKLLERYFGPLSSAAAACGRSTSVYLRNLGRAICGFGPAATSATASGVSAAVEETQEQQDVLLRENDGNLSHQLRQHSAGGSRQSAGHSNIFLSNAPFEGVEAAEEQISAVGSQQSAMPGQISILGGLFTAAGAIITVNISKPPSDPALARVLGLVAVGVAVGAELISAYGIIILWVTKLQDGGAAAARPAPGTLTWVFYNSGILWAISLLVTLAAHTAAYMIPG